MESEYTDFHFKAQALDVEHKRVLDDQEAVYTFDRLLLVMCGTPALALGR